MSEIQATVQGSSGSNRMGIRRRTEEMINSFSNGLHRHLPLAFLLILSGCATTPPVKQSALPALAETSSLPNQDKAPGNEVVDITAQDSPEVLPAKSDPCQQEQPLDTLDAYAGFLRTCPSSPRRQDMLVAMCRLIGKQKDAYEGYKKFSAEFPDGLPCIPSRHQLALIGPEGMRVHDCVEDIKRGEETGVILEKVRRQKGTYKDFTFDEIDTLKQMGLTSNIIQAMLESTLEAQRRNEALQRKKEWEQRQAGSPPGQQSYQTPSSGQGGNLSPVLEAVRNCASQAAALEACKNLSGFARSLCNAAAKSQFPCQ